MHDVVVEMKYSIEDKNCRIHFIPIRHFYGVKIFSCFSQQKKVFFTILKKVWTKYGQILLYKLVACKHVEINNELISLKISYSF